MDHIEYRSISSLIFRECVKGKSDSSVKQVYTVSNTLGIVHAEAYRDRNLYSDDTSNYTIIRPRMFAYNPSRLNVGSIGTLNTDIPGLVSPMYIVFSFNDRVITKEFLLHLLKSTYVQTQIEALKEEGARFRFNFARWNKIIVPIPPIEKQREIADILDAMEKYAAELAARRKQFAWYRDRMIKEANKTSKLVAFTDCCNIFNNKRRPISKNQRVFGKYPYYGANGVQDYVNDYIFDGDYILIGEDGSVIDEYGYPIVNYTTGKFWVNNHAHILQTTTIADQSYIFHFLQTINISDLVHENISKLTLSILKDLSIPLPPIEKQREIAA